MTLAPSADGLQMMLGIEFASVYTWYTADMRALETIRELHTLTVLNT